MDGRPDGRPSSAPRAIPHRPPALSLPRGSDGAPDALPSSVEAIAGFATSPLSAKVRAKWSEARASDGGGSLGARLSSTASPRTELATRLAAAQARREQVIGWVMGRARRLRRAPPLSGQEAELPASVAAVLFAASPRTPGPVAQMSPHEAWAPEGVEGAWRRCVASCDPRSPRVDSCSHALLTHRAAGADARDSRARAQTAAQPAARLLRLPLPRSALRSSLASQRLRRVAPLRFPLASRARRPRGAAHHATTQLAERRSAALRWLRAWLLQTRGGAVASLLVAPAQPACPRPPR